MKMKAIESITTEDEARQVAIDWQHWYGLKDHYMSELADWNDYFETLANKFDLTEEFKENGII